MRWHENLKIFTITKKKWREKNKTQQSQRLKKSQIVTTLIMKEHNQRMQRQGWRTTKCMISHTLGIQFLKLRKIKEWLKIWQMLTSLIIGQKKRQHKLKKKNKNYTERKKIWPKKNMIRSLREYLMLTM